MLSGFSHGSCTLQQSLISTDEYTLFHVEGAHHQQQANFTLVILGTSRRLVLLRALDQASAAGQGTVHTHADANRGNGSQSIASLLSRTLPGSDAHHDLLWVALSTHTDTIHRYMRYYFFTSHVPATMIQFPHEKFSDAVSITEGEVNSEKN